MQAGDLDRRVAFDAATASSDGYGGTVDGWSEALRCWARYRYLRGGEVVQAARLDGRQVVVVTVRASAAASSIGPDHRMRDLNTGEMYNVRAGPVPSEDRGWLEFTCESGVAA